MNDSLFDVADQVVVITGGLGQLGAAYTDALLERGARVAILDRSSIKGVGAHWSLAIRERRLLVREVDITNRAALEDALVAIVDALSTPTALVNNAALDTPPGVPSTLENGPFETYPEESWEKVMAVNVKGTFLCCQVIGGAMARAGRGAIVNVGSIYGKVSPDQSIYQYRQQRGEVFFKPVAYSASKSAIYNLTRYLATYWAKQGVRVNTLTLAGVANNQDPEFLAAYEGRIPLGRMAKAREYCGAVIFLVSDASSYMTGSELVVDGGWTAI